MPLKTFNNLDKKRQEEIRQKAYKEFAFNDYKNASLSNIIKELGLAKGSFYRYFKNKLELYEYLLEHATQLRMKQVNHLIQGKHDDLFNILIENFSNKIDFDFKYPLESIFLYRVLLETNTPEIQHLITGLKQNVLKYVEQLLKELKKAGMIRQDINIQLTAFTIFQVQVGLFEYLSLYKGVDFVKNIEEGKTVFSISKTEIMVVVEKMVELLKIGINKQITINN